jgi:hypothetical protein
MIVASSRPPTMDRSQRTVRERGNLLQFAPAMTPEERQLANDLCQRIAEEKDLSIFQQLVEQLDELLARKRKRLDGAKPPNPD